MNWLDLYIKNHESGYLMNYKGGLFVEIDCDYVRHASGDSTGSNFREITKDEFISELFKGRDATCKN